MHAIETLPFTITKAVGRGIISRYEISGSEGFSSGGGRASSAGHLPIRESSELLFRSNHLHCRRSIRRRGKILELVTTMVFLPLRPLANVTLVLLLLAVAASSTTAFSVDPTSSRYFVGRLARRLGIVDFYSSLYRGVKHKLLRPYFGGRRRPRLLRGHRQQLPHNQHNHVRLFSLQTESQ